MADVHIDPKHVSHFVRMPIRVRHRIYCWTCLGDLTSFETPKLINLNDKGVRPYQSTAQSPLTCAR